MLLQEGEKAPDFEVLDQHGTPVRLADLRGKKVILYFYPKDNTPGCTEQACNLRDHYAQLKSVGYIVLGVSGDSPKSHQNFIEKQKLPFSLLADVDKILHRKVWHLGGKIYVWP